MDATPTALINRKLMHRPLTFAAAKRKERISAWIQLEVKRRVAEDPFAIGYNVFGTREQILAWDKPTLQPMFLKVGDIIIYEGKKMPITVFTNPAISPSGAVVLTGETRQGMNVHGFKPGDQVTLLKVAS